MKKTFLVLFVGLLFGYFIGKINFPKIQSPFRDWRVFTSETSFRKEMVEFILDKKKEGCKSEFTNAFGVGYADGTYWGSFGSGNNFWVVCEDN